MLAYSVTIIIALVIVIAACFYLREQRWIKRRRDALAYLVEKTDSVYFYGKKVSQCLKEGTVYSLGTAGIGDYSKAMGSLVLYALHLAGNLDARLEYKYLAANEVVPERYSVYVRFRHNGRYWLLRLRGRRLDEVNFHRDTHADLNGFSTMEYFDLPKHQRFLLGNCTDPSRSYLQPDHNYQNLSVDELKRAVESELQAQKPLV